jgi:hypothetical protein
MLLSRIKLTAAVAAAALLALTLAGTGLWQVRARAGERAPRLGGDGPAVRKAGGEALPGGGFRVTVNDVVRDDSTVVAQVDIDAPPGSRIEVLSDKDKRTTSRLITTTVLPAPNRAGAPPAVRLTVFGDQIEWKGGATPAVKFMLAYQLGKITSSTSESGTMPPGARQLGDVLQVLAKSGEYKYGQVTKLVVFKGVTYSLVVNRPD